MKRFMIFTLIFVMLGGAMIVIWADTRKRNVDKDYGTCSSTDSDGPLSAEASITVDIDYPGEGEDFIEVILSKT